MAKKIVRKSSGKTSKAANAAKKTATKKTATSRAVRNSVHLSKPSDKQIPKASAQSPGMEIPSFVGALLAVNKPLKVAFISHNGSTISAPGKHLVPPRSFDQKAIPGIAVTYELASAVEATNIRIIG